MSATKALQPGTPTNSVTSPPPALPASSTGLPASPLTPLVCPHLHHVSLAGNCFPPNPDGSRSSHLRALAWKFEVLSPIPSLSSVFSAVFLSPKALLFLGTAQGEERLEVGLARCASRCRGSKLGLQPAGIGKPLQGFTYGSGMIRFILNCSLSG